MVTAYYRDVVRQRILRTRPVTDTTDSCCELHVLTSASDWLNLIWSLKTFYYFADRRYSLCVHEDGSVPQEGLDQLRRHFPDSRLIRRAEADSRVAEELLGHAESLEFRRTNLLAPKVFDFRVYLNSSRMLVFDSDLLFFQKPVALLNRIEDPSYMLNTFNADVGSAYTVVPDIISKHFGFALTERVNSGLGLVHRDALRWDWTEAFLSLPGIKDGHFWRIEQTLYALLGSRWGLELLPEPDYTLCFDEGINGRPFRHYVGRIRHLMYKEGIRHLQETGFLKQLSI